MPFRHDPLLARLEPLQKLRRYRTLGYVMAVASVALATMLREAFPAALASTAYATYFLAVVVTALFGNIRAGLLAVAFTALAVDVFFLPPWNEPGAPAKHVLILFALIVVFSATAAAISVLQTLIDRLWQQERNLRSVLDFQPAGIAMVCEDDLIFMANRAFARIFATVPSVLIDHKITALLPEAAKPIRAVLQAGVAPEQTSFETFAVRDGGVRVPVEVSLAPITRHGQRGVLVNVSDITERKIAERAKQALSREVQHRSRNVLAMVDAIIVRTLAQERSIAEARHVLLSTLRSFRHTHEVLTANDRITLNEIVARELSSFSTAASVHGDELLLRSSAAMNFSLIIHELCTNAAKFGSLSMPEGKVMVQWQVNNGVVAFAWIETDGPPVYEPEHTGFGSTLLNELPKSWGAKVSLEFAPQGLVYSLVVDEPAIAIREAQVA